MKLFKIGLKLLGLYFIISGVTILPSMLILSISFPEPTFLSYSTTVLMPIIMIISGMFLFIKTDKFTEISQHGLDDDNSNDMEFHFSSAIQILGIYFAVFHLSYALSDSILVVVSHGNQEKTLLDTEFYKNIFIAFIGLILIVKGNKIASYINDTTK